MRNVLLALFIVLIPFAGKAQTFLTQSGDSVTGYYTQVSGDMNVHNNIKSASATPVTLTWKAVSFQLGVNWKMTGFCDNNVCQTNLPDSNPPHGLVLNTASNSTTFTSNPVTNANFNTPDNDFHAQYDASAAANGTHSWIKMNFKDNVGGYDRTLTFIGRKGSTGLYSVTTSSDDIVLFPNPASEAINVIYDAKADIRTIAVYNLIGKLMGPIYKPSSTTSAKIDLEDMPNGVYFLRLMNAQGHVVATRRFTRQ